MKVTNGELFNAKEPLNGLLEAKLPVRASMALVQMAKKLNDTLGQAEEVRNGLIKKWGEPDPTNPSQMWVAPDSPNMPKFKEEYEELLAMETEIIFNTVDLPSDIELSGKDFIALEKFITIS